MNGAKTSLAWVFDAASAWASRQEEDTEGLDGLFSDMTLILQVILCKAVGTSGSGISSARTLLFSQQVAEDSVDSGPAWTGIHPGLMELRS